MKESESKEIMNESEFKTQELNATLDLWQCSFKRALRYLDRGLCQCYDNPRDGILVLGINPSYTNDDTYVYSFANEKDKYEYFRSIAKLCGELSDKVGYMDLFPIKESDQKKFTMEIITNDAGMEMLCDMVSDVQREIEALKPRLIILNNRELGAFVGLSKKFTWMGYQFEDVPNPIEDKKVNLYRIIGIKSDNVGGIPQTNLVGTYVLHYGLYKFVNKYKDKILNESDIKKLWKSFCED